MRSGRFMTIYVPQEVRAAVELEAQRRLCSLTDIVREALVEYFQRNGIKSDARSVTQTEATQGQKE